MDDRVLKILEFDKIINKLSSYAQSDMGKELASMLKPSRDLDSVRILHEQTEQAETMLYRLGRSPVDAFPDVRVELKKSGATLALGPRELLLIARAARAARLCKESLTGDEVKGHISRLASSLVALRYIEEEIMRCILSEDEMADNASAKLFSLRKQIRGCNERVREKLNQMIHSNTYKTYLQEAIITVRGGRYVLPVRQEYRSQVPGIVHDQSGSGATLFIEPMAVVEIGNELRKLQGEEREEIERILCALTQSVAPNADALAQSMEIMAILDVIFAKAKLARDMKAVRPKLNNNGVISIAQGRHPLLDPQHVVPIDIWLGKGFRSLIITGPNTGGKTVTLKTVGLFCAMAQAGIFLPAAQGVETAVFSDIFADIGDEQSIEQSLSTFSSHMGHIVKILDQADENSLVLLDELGSGTDPVEGAALAMAILDELHERKCIVLATTHYSELKAFALAREGMENASMEFDVKTLSPTYRLFIGIPGKSNAFEISRRLGLNDRIIERAQKNLDHEALSFEDVISSAESQRRIAEEERRMAELAREELYKLRDEAEHERAKLEEQRAKMLKKAQEQAQTVVRQAQRDAEEIIQKLKQVDKDAGQPERSRAIQQARDALRSQQMAGNVEKAETDYGPPPKTVSVGQSVYVVSLDQDATVLKAPDSKGEVQVQAGIIKMHVKLGDIREPVGKKRAEQAGRTKRDIAPASASMEVDVRGMAVDEAEIEIDRFLDSAYLSGIHEVMIIHGKGTGALRSGVHAFLKRSKHVKGFRLGRFGEGEAGVTVVEIK